MEKVETIIIGGGQAGLSTSYHLKHLGREHIVFEQLPGPSYRNFFRVVTDKGSKPTDAIYEIVKHFTNTTLIKG